MRNKPPILRITIFFLLLFGFSFAVTSYQLRMQQQTNRSQSAKSTFPVDGVGRDIGLVKSAQRIAVIGPGATETIFEMGLGNRIVGRDQFSNFPPAALNIPIIGNYTGPFYEKIIAAHPDLLIMQGETWNNAAQLNQISQKIGVPVAALNATSLQEAASDMRKIGAWLGKSDAANQLAQLLEQLVKDAPAANTTAFIQISKTPLWTAGSDTLVGDAVNKSGFRNVADVTGYKQFNMESLLALNPEVYIVSTDESDVAKVLSSLKHDTNLSKLPAIKDGRVIVINGDLLLRPSTRLAEGVTQLRAAKKK